MRTIAIATVCACCTFLTTPTFADEGCCTTASAPAVDDQPVNTMCPVGKEAIVEGVPTLEYKGDTIGFCCPGCNDEFMGWSQEDRDLFVANAKKGIYAAADAPQAKAPAEPAAISYPFNTCPISGGQLGGMGDPIVKVYDGREVKFCCAMCVPTFEKDLIASFKELDQKIIASQINFYPMTTCLVSDKPILGEGVDEPIKFVHNNRLIQTCCTRCAGKFKKDPDAYLGKLDKAVIAQQADLYPLKSCPISGGGLGSKGDPIQIIFQGRLIKFCCSMCIPEFEANPLPTIAKLDAAWMAMHNKSHP